MRIKVRVKAGARKEAVVATAIDRLEISVKEKPKDNAANRRVVELIARRFHCPTSKVRIVRGHTSTSKLLEVLEL